MRKENSPFTDQSYTYSAISGSPRGPLPPATPNQDNPILRKSKKTPYNWAPSNKRGSIAPLPLTSPPGAPKDPPTITLYNPLAFLRTYKTIEELERTMDHLNKLPPSKHATFKTDKAQREILHQNKRILFLQSQLQPPPITGPPPPPPPPTHPPSPHRTLANKGQHPHAQDTPIARPTPPPAPPVGALRPRTLSSSLNL